MTERQYFWKTVGFEWGPGKQTARATLQYVSYTQMNHGRVVGDTARRETLVPRDAQQQLG